MNDVIGGVFKYERIIDSIDVEDVLYLLENECDEDMREIIGEMSDDDLKAVIDFAADRYCRYIDDTGLRSDAVIVALAWLANGKMAHNG